MGKHMANNTQVLFFIALAGSTLAGCDHMRNTFGLDHYQADEFKVPTNPPLSMPPNYDLRPPMPGAENPGTVNYRDYAQEKIMGQKVALAKVTSETEKSILHNALKTAKADPDIRRKINKEAEKDETLLGKLKNIGDKISSNVSKGSGGENYREEVAAPKAEAIR